MEFASPYSPEIAFSSSLVSCMVSVLFNFVVYNCFINDIPCLFILVNGKQSFFNALDKSNKYCTVSYPLSTSLSEIRIGNYRKMFLKVIIDHITQIFKKDFKSYSSIFIRYCRTN